jgi:single-strand DNA-binding protein
MLEMMNDVLLEGELVNDPESRTLQSGSKLTTFIVSSVREYEDSKGEKRSDTGDFPCEMWGEKGVTVSNTVKKGNRVILRGKLKQDRWEVDGEPRSKFKLKIFECVILPSSTPQELPSSTSHEEVEKITKVQSNIPF